MRLVLTARDVGAAGHIAALAGAATEHHAVCLVLCEGPARAYLERRGVACIEARDWLATSGARMPDGTGHGVRIAQAKLGEWAADLVVCGQSAADERGIDETIVAAARLRGIPSFVIQDFWGDMRVDPAMQPDHYLVMDEQAARLTRARTRAAVHVVGSIKHARFASVDFADLRVRGRRLLGLAPGTPLIGYFGQDLTCVPGYRQVLQDVGRAVSAMEGAALFYRPHPREGASGRALSLSALQAAGVRPHMADRMDVEMAIASSDLVLSCFSTVGLDAAYMMCSPGAPEVSIVCADYPADVAGYWRPVTGLPEFPLVTEALALPASDFPSLAAALRTGMDGGARQRTAVLSRAVFGDASTALQRTFGIIQGVVSPWTTGAKESS